MFDTPQTVVAVEDTPYAKVILTQTLTIRLTKLCYVIGIRQETQALELSTNRQVNPAQQQGAAFPRACVAPISSKEMVYVDLDLGAQAVHVNTMLTDCSGASQTASLGRTPHLPLSTGVTRVLHGLHR